MNELISVILPVYNGEKYLAEAIESILSQTFEDFEFIILDDGSTDKSLEIIKKFKSLDNRIVVISRENKGLIATLNEGIKKAKGKYIARMDQDDISLPKRFEEQVKLMEKENLDICGCHYFSLDEDGQINGLNFTPISHDMCFLSLASKVPFAHPSVMMRKEFLKMNDLEYGQSGYKIAEDFDMWMRMYANGAKFGNVNDILFKYRILSNSLSRVTNKGIARDTISMLNDFFKSNKNDLFKTMEHLPKKLNDEEKSLVVRVVFKLVFKSYTLSPLKYLKFIDKKILACTILSELVNG